MTKSAEELLTFTEANKELFLKASKILVLWFGFGRLIEDVFAPSINSLLKDLAELNPNLNAAVVELRNAYVELRTIFLLNRGRGSTGGTKQGRRAIWKGYEGFRLVVLVKAIRQEKRRGLAHAIRLAVKTDPVLGSCKAICKLSDAALQARYQDAANHWVDIAKPREHEARAGRARDSVLGCTQRLSAALERLAAALRFLSPEQQEVAFMRFRAAQLPPLTPKQEKLVNDFRRELKEIEGLQQVAERFFVMKSDFS